MFSSLCSVHHLLIYSFSFLKTIGGVFNYSSNLKQKELERERDKAQELSKVKSVWRVRDREEEERRTRMEESIDSIFIIGIHSKCIT